MFLTLKKALIQYSKRKSAIDMIDLSNQKLREIGIGNYGDLDETGESNLLRFISGKISKKKSVVFDVGANIGSNGQYANLFRRYFPRARIFAFEPNPHAYLELCRATMNDHNQINEDLALGVKNGIMSHFADPSIDKTELSGVNGEIFSEFFKFKKKPLRYDVKVRTLDSYCRIKKIEKIDFLKVDVEGSEYSVLLGAKKMLRSRKIDYIQFEFNIHNIYSRIFIKDFYNLLNGYYLYRLLPHGFLPLGEYSTEYEVFRYQNILASKSKITL